MPYSGGLKRNIVQCLEDYDIPLYLSTTVAEIHGKERVEGVTIASVDEHRRIIEETRRFIPCDTLLLSVGLIPENELTRAAGIAIDSVTGGAEVDENRETDQRGIFACGNVLHVHDLVDYVSDEAETAGIGAAEFVKNSNRTSKNLSPADAPLTVRTKAGGGVRYVLPQQVGLTGGRDTALFLRVSEPRGKVRFTVSAETPSGKETLALIGRLKAAPGEMEKIIVKSERLAALAAQMTGGTDSANTAPGECTITVSLEEIS